MTQLDDAHLIFIAFVVLVTIFGVFIDTVMFAILSGRRAGMFKVLRDDARTLTCASNLGGFSVDRVACTLGYTLSDQRGSLSFSEIKGIEYQARVDWASLEEFVLGFDATDLLPQYRDTIEWFSIAAVTHRGKRIPLYLRGNFRHREFLMGWYIELQTVFLTRLGLLEDMEENSRSVLDRILAHADGVELI